MITADQIAEDVAYIRRRAAETGLELCLRVSQSGFTVAAFVGGRNAGSSTYHTERPTDPLPAGCFQLSVDRAIANAMRKA